VIGGAFGGGRVGIFDTGVVTGVATPAVMWVVSGWFACGFDGIGSAGCGGGCWSRGRGSCGERGGSVLGTIKVGMEYASGVPRDVGLGTLKTEAPCTAAVAPPDMVSVGVIVASANVSGTAWPVLPT
jgi:hypothetical protein